MHTSVLANIKMLTDLDNKTYAAILLQNDVDTPSEDMIEGLGCFSATCQVFLLLRYFVSCLLVQY